jgi:hypothetical protein
LSAKSIEEHTGTLSRCLFLWEVGFNSFVIIHEFDRTVIEANPSVLESTEGEGVPESLGHEAEMCNNCCELMAKAERGIVSKRGHVEIHRKLERITVLVTRTIPPIFPGDLDEQELGQSLNTQPLSPVARRISGFDSENPFECLESERAP